MALTNKNTHQSGFTLVELAIVMIIIGLLIGGVLKGQQLIENAKITAVITELKGFQVAMISFQNTYGGLPGDMRNAQARLSGCAAGNANFCRGGNGDAIVGAVSDNIMIFNSGGDTENTQFWKHLALADLVTGIDPSANPANPAWGSNFPSSSLRGGYHVLYNNDRWGNAEYGHNFRMQNTLTNPSVGNVGDQPLSPLQAFQIDIKIDDGKPNSGVISSDDGRGGASDCEGDAYGLVSGSLTKRKDCVLIYAP